MKNNLRPDQYNFNCSICNSPYAPQIHKVKTDHPSLTFSSLARVIKEKLPTEFADVNEELLAQRLNRHFRAGHQPVDLNQINFTDPADPKEEKSYQKALQDALKAYTSGRVSWTEVLEKARLFAFKNMLDNPTAVKLKDYIMAERAQTDKDRLSVEAETNAMMRLITFILRGGEGKITCPFCNHRYLPDLTKTLKEAGMTGKQIAEGEIVEAEESPKEISSK